MRDPYETLGRELVAAAYRQNGPTSARSRFARWWRRRGPVALLTPVVALAGTAVALASGVIGTGTPVKPIPGSTDQPRQGNGVVITPQRGLLPLRVPDPAGGPPWGMRYVRTSRGLGCVEVGRVVHGRLGLLGADGLYHDDGLFHPFAKDSFDPPCTPLDGHGHAFLSEASNSFYAAGVPLDGYGCLRGRADATHSECVPSDRRELAFGLTGPDGRSITYREHGRLVTEPTVGADGAYLVVLKPTSPPEGLSVGARPDRPITKVTYRNGSICRVSARWHAGAGPCELVGYVPPNQRPRIPANIQVPLRLHLQARHGRSYSYYIVRVSFRAPVAVTNIHSSYVLTLHTTGACTSDSYAAQSNADIRTGQHITLEAQVPARQTLTPRVSPRAAPKGHAIHERVIPRSGARCGAIVHGTVELQGASGRLASSRESDIPVPGGLIGRFNLNTHKQ